MSCIQFAGHSNRLASCSRDGTIRVWYDCRCQNSLLFQSGSKILSIEPHPKNAGIQYGIQILLGNGLQLCVSIFLHQTGAVQRNIAMTLKKILRVVITKRDLAKPCLESIISIWRYGHAMIPGFCCRRQLGIAIH